MLLILSIVTKNKKINVSNLIFYLLFLLLMLYFSKTIFFIWTLIDIYLFLLIKNILVVKKNVKSDNKSMTVEVITEGISKKESDNLLDTLIDYSNKLT
jgi:hypothetical protein